MRALKKQKAAMLAIGDKEEADKTEKRIKAKSAQNLKIIKTQ